MPINVRCPQGHALAVAEKHAGHRVKCPQCQSVLNVPGTNGVAAAKNTDPTERAAPPKNDTPKPPPLPKPRSNIADEPPIPVPPPQSKLVSIAPPIAERSPAVQGYRAERYRAVTVRWLGVALAVLVVFQLAPALKHWNPATAPDWARCVALLAVVQLAYAVWMISLPDWSTVRVMMFVLAGVATLYGAALGVAMITPPTKPLLLDMDDVRRSAPLWCAAVLLLVCLMTYLCGRVGFRWRKACQ